jgi:hypothetical protein
MRDFQIKTGKYDHQTVANLQPKMAYASLPEAEYQNGPTDGFVVHFGWQVSRAGYQRRWAAERPYPGG